MFLNNFENNIDDLLKNGLYNLAYFFITQFMQCLFDCGLAKRPTIKITSTQINLNYYLTILE